MKTKKIIFTFMIFGLIAFLITSCKKDEEETQPQQQEQGDEVGAAKDDAIADKLFSDVTDIVDEAMRGQKSNRGVVVDTIFMGPCVIVTIDTLAFPFTITVDFGDTNCLCHDGKFRRGKILVEHTGPYWAVGTVITHTFDNYFVNEHQLLGTKIVTNQGLNSNNNLTWTVHVDGQVIKPNNGGTITWIADRMREWAHGHNTPFIWWDDVYLITGSHNVVSSNGNTLSVTITRALEIALNCYWIKSGTVEMQHNEWPLIILDYGNGNCDDIATVTINGNTHTIHLN